MENNHLKKNGSYTVNCFQCNFFFITWDPVFPKGCKGIGFKTKNLPSVDVFNSSGIVCQKFDKKDDNSK